MIDQLVSNFGLVEAKTYSVPIHPSTNLHNTTDHDKGEFKAAPHLSYKEILCSLFALV